MFAEFHFLEESLKDFLTEAQIENHISPNTALYKYNNLRLYMDPKKSPVPHIIVRIGISEVMYDIKTLDKISGGLGTDERLIKRWFDRNMEKFDFSTNWRDANRPKPVSVKEDDMDNPL